MLSKETTDQIRKEAEDMYGPDGNGFYNRSAYIIGAKKWAVWKEKAEGLAKVLRALRTSLCAQQNSFEEDNSEYGILQDNLNDIDKALEQFK